MRCSGNECINLDSDYYKNPVPKSMTVIRGHKTEICHPHARVVQRLPLHELRDDKTTYVFRLTGAADLLAYVVVKTDGSWEVFCMPAEVARDDASSAGLTSTDDGCRYYCVILDQGSWTKRTTVCSSAARSTRRG